MSRIRLLRDQPKEQRTRTVQNEMKDRAKSIRLMPHGKSYECGWLVFNRRSRKNDYFIREYEVGTYGEAKKWLDEQLEHQ